MSPTVLLVDVASMERDEWKAFLQNLKYAVFTAEDSETALKESIRLQPDLILLRDHPPKMSGFELCRRLKANPLNELIPIVIIKASPDETDILHGREAGAADFWGDATAPADALSRLETLLRLKNYIDQQATSVVVSLAHSIEAKHLLTEGHSERLAEYAVQLGTSLGLGAAELRQLRIASLLHDIGKVALPDSILFKPGPLTEEEGELVQQHPVVGEKICAPLKSLREILPVIRHHHERMDGSGYPDGLCGDEIPLKARILQIADIYDALTSDRPYREALTSDEALQVLRYEAMKGWLDALLVWRFSRIRVSGSFLPVRGSSMLASYCS
jgi:putative two-component system response regulator